MSSIAHGIWLSLLNYSICPLSTLSIDFKLVSSLGVNVSIVPSFFFVLGIWAD